MSDLDVAGNRDATEAANRNSESVEQKPAPVPELGAEAAAGEITPDVLADRERFMADLVGEPARRAVNDPIPPGADADLLEHLRGYVEHTVNRLDRLWASGDPAIPPEDLAAEFDKAATRLAELEVRQMMTAAPAAPVLTLQAIERDPWNVYVLDVPKDASPALNAAVADAAQRLLDPNDRPPPPFVVRSDDEWADIGNALKTIWRDASLAPASELGREAWQAPEFSYATIAADPWTAVHLPMPAAPDRALLETARDAVRDLERYAEGNGALSTPLHSERQFTREQNLEAIGARLGELDDRLELLKIEQLRGNLTADETLERDRALIGRYDGMREVDGGEPRLGLHQPADDDLSRSGSNAEKLAEQFASAVDIVLGHEAPNRPQDRTHGHEWPPQQPVELEAGPIPPSYAAPDYNFLSTGKILDTGGERLARTTDLVLDTIYWLRVSSLPDRTNTSTQSRTVDHHVDVMTP